MNKLTEKLEKLFKINRESESIEAKVKFLLFRTVIVCFFLGVLAFLATLFINIFMISLTAGDIYEPDEIQSSDISADCAIILGCQVLPSGQPSTMLRHRLETGAQLYFDGKVKKIIVSGDHGADHYDESNTMKNYLIDMGIPSEDIFMDHAGFSTYESLYRARDVFCAKRVIIVSQKYHLYRALYIADQLGIEAYGVGADVQRFYGQTTREMRESLARVKDFLYCMLQPSPTYLGETIPVSGNGDDLAAFVVVLEPRDDDGRVQTARVGQDDLLDIFLIHGKPPYTVEISSEYLFAFSDFMHTLYQFPVRLSIGNYVVFVNISANILHRLLKYPLPLSAPAEPVWINSCKIEYFFEYSRFFA